MEFKKVYYYVICVIAFFILMWGTVDLISTGLGLVNVGGSGAGWRDSAVDNPPVMGKNDQFFDSYYQNKMLYDRLWDSLARVLVAGAVFLYCRRTVNKLEQQG